MFIPNPIARFGEEAACKFLEQKGYKIIERNFRKSYGEIDIVSVYKDILVFVEVKTRSTSLYGGAKESISKLKIKKLTKTIQFYKFSHPGLPDALRMDAILIDLKDGRVKNIEHIEDITT